VAKRKGISPEPRFGLGDVVRVRQGTRDPDFPDIPMGGWVGTIKEVEAGSAPTHYCVAWSRDTLASIHPVFRRRCERDGLDYEQTYLAEDDLEPYAGEAVSVEQPGAIDTPVLSPDNQDDRIRMTLGLTGDDPIPDVDPSTLAMYWNHLRQHLSLPFAARHCPEDGPENDVSVIALPDPDQYDCDEFCGLLCEGQLRRRQITIPLGEIEVAKRNPNHQLMDDYLYWFWNWR
jgi:hypothetical protein